MIFSRQEWVRDASTSISRNDKITLFSGMLQGRLSFTWWYRWHNTLGCKHINESGGSDRDLKEKTPALPGDEGTTRRQNEKTEGSGSWYTSVVKINTAQ